MCQEAGRTQTPNRSPFYLFVTREFTSTTRLITSPRQFRFVSQSCKNTHSLISGFCLSAQRFSLSISSTTRRFSRDFKVQWRRNKIYQIVMWDANQRRFNFVYINTYFLHSVSECTSDALTRAGFLHWLSPDVNWGPLSWCFPVFEPIPLLRQFMKTVQLFAVIFLAFLK